MCQNSVTFHSQILVALGANLPGEQGPPAVTLGLAVDRLSDSGLVVADVSRLYSTPCFPAGTGPDYVNAAIKLTGNVGPAAVLRILHEIEHEFGRARVQRWGSRTLDLDLIAVGGTVLPDPETYMHWQKLDAETQRSAAPDQLILPHPRLQDRAFVLVPLCDVAPDWRHPVLGNTVREMVEALPKFDRDAVEPL